MTLYILDTDILTLLQDGNAAVQEHVKLHSPQELAITIISVEEQLSGWYSRLRRAKTAPDLARVYGRFTLAVASLAGLKILSFAEPAIHRYEQLRKLKFQVRKMDLRIASIVLEQPGVLVTRNVRDYQGIPGLRIEDWSL